MRTPRQASQRRTLRIMDGKVPTHLDGEVETVRREEERRRAVKGEGGVESGGEEERRREEEN